MPRLSIYLLGSPKLELDGIPISLPTTRAIPLIAYLALTGKSQRRETLANLLWPDSNQKQALAALRTTLWRMKAYGLQGWINIDRNGVGLSKGRTIDIDVENFQGLIEKCNHHGHPASQICLYCTPLLTEAIELYHGEFMAGLNLSNSPTFDDWRMQQSEGLRSLHLSALERLVKCHRTFGDFNLAINSARTWLKFDPLNELAYFQLLQLYSIAGQRTSGISLYKQYKDALSRELGIEPSEEISALYQEILKGQLVPSKKESIKTPIFLLIGIDKAPIYWAQAGENKFHILSVYNNIVKETAQRFGGFILQRSDNSITLFFEHGQPLHCAVTIHLKLRKADWGDLGPPNIRMVLYSTILEGENPDNFAVLTRAASSLLAISWGGQIVFTDQTLRLLDTPPGSNIRDLGYHFLNETDGAAHIYELLHPHLPAIEHPPLQTSKDQLVNFPSLDPPFIGREQAINELEELLIDKDHRLISLVGPGGVGKTRLAAQVASRVIKSFPDGIFFISFTAVEDPDYIPIVIADVLKFNFYGPTDYLDQLRRYLHRMKALLVIDNFEHLRGEGAARLSFILTQTHLVKILVTTRERLNMIAETIYEVQGLPIPSSPTVVGADKYSSIQLFLQNAQRTFPRFSYQPNSEAIIRICQLVDGMPLGIVLASSWVRVFSCPEIASEIKRNIEFLTTTSTDIDPRHRSIIAVFTNSWKLMSEEERRILSRLSVFQAAFTAQAANEICDATPLLLSVLMDKSLLSHRPDDRYVMLATFHQYVFNKLESDEAELAVTKTRFCEYYANFCAQKHPEFYSGNHLNALSEMVSEIENIRTAWSWMIEADRWDLIERLKEPLLTHHAVLGNYVQGREFFHLAWVKLQKLSNPETVLLRASMQQLSAWMTFRNGFIAEGIQGLEESLQIFRACDARGGIADSLQSLSEAYRLTGKLQRGLDCIEEALAIREQNNHNKSAYDIALIARCQSVRGWILTQLGKSDQARQSMQASLAAYDRQKNPYGTIHPLMGLGMLAYLEGDYLQAKNIYQQALDTAVQFNDQRDQVLLHNRLGAVYEVLANPEKVYHHVISAYKLCQESGDHHLTAVTLNNLAYQQLRHLHQPSEAIWTYQKCLEIFTSIGDLRGIAYTSYDVSKAYLAVGLVDEARSYCISSMQTSRTLDSTPLLLHSFHGFVHLFVHRKAYERALQLCYLIINHPLAELDTQKRAIVSKVELEANLPPEVCRSASRWGQKAQLSDVIDQILSEKTAW